MITAMARIISERRSTIYAIILGVWAIVAVYAVLHDQYIVRIAPEHFTEYHRPLFNIKDPKTLAAAYAFGSSIAPGLLLGLACALVARVQLASREIPTISVRFIFSGCLIVIVATEIVSAAAGYWVSKTGHMLYFSSWYPDWSLPMLITQTIQLTCYFSSAVFSSIFIILLIQKRRLSRKIAD